MGTPTERIQLLYFLLIDSNLKYSSVPCDFFGTARPRRMVPLGERPTYLREKSCSLIFVNEGMPFYPATCVNILIGRVIAPLDSPVAMRNGFTKPLANRRVRGAISRFPPISPKGNGNGNPSVLPRFLRVDWRRVRVCQKLGTLGFGGDLYCGRLRRAIFDGDILAQPRFVQTMISAGLNAWPAICGRTFSFPHLSRNSRHQRQRSRSLLTFWACDFPWELPAIDG
jgi:hypothetical protein